MLKVGDSAPAFTLVSNAKKEVSLEDYKDKNLVLLFFPMAFTGVCTTELCQMRDGITDYNNLNAEVLAVSVDSPFTLEKYSAEQSLNFPLLSDFNKEVSTAYDTLHDVFAFGMKGVSKRSAFVIDQKGTVQYAEVLDNPGELPNFTAVKETLNRLN